MSLRKLSFALAINEALHQMMAKDSSVFVLGQGSKSPWYVAKTCDGLLKRFGEDRVIDPPVSEAAMTGAGVGAAIAGMRPVVIHPRLDFMVYGLEPIINEAANWYYMFGGRSMVPMVIWGVINRGKEQGAQHSQALQALFAHLPGLKVVMPSTPYDAKGLMIAAILDNNPVVYIDDRWLYSDKGEVPKKIYKVPIGKGIIRRRGQDVTIVAVSYMAKEAMKAAKELAKQGVSAEVIDVRTVKPLDMKLIISSLKKTRRLLVTEAAWCTGSVAGEILARVSEERFRMKAPAVRVCLPDTPAPMSRTLEKAYYITSKDIVSAAQKIMR